MPQAIRLGVADDHARDAGEGEPGDVERAGRATAAGSAGPSGTRCRGCSAPGAGRWPAAACPSRSAARRPPTSSSRRRRPSPSRSGTADTACAARGRPARLPARAPRAALGDECRARVGPAGRFSGSADRRPRLVVGAGSPRRRRPVARRRAIGACRVVGVGRVELLDPLDVLDRAVDPGAGQLVVVVAAQVPRHRLEPGDGVRRRPRLDPGQRCAEAEHGVVQPTSCEGDRPAM